MHHLLGEVLKAECAGIDQFGCKHDLVFRRGLRIKVKLHLEIGRCQVPGVDIHGDVDVGLALLR